MGKSDSKIVAHARRELQMAGAFERTPDYDGSIGRGVLAMCKVFSDWAGNDKAKMESIAMGFNQIIGGGLLSPPTQNPDEWEPIEGAGDGVVRNKRSPFYVSNDNGKTWSHLETKETGASAKYESEASNVTKDTKEEGPKQDISTDDNERGGVDEGGEDAESTGTDSTGADDAGRELDPGVAEESTQDQAESENAPSESENRETK